MIPTLLISSLIALQPAPIDASDPAPAGEGPVVESQGEPMPANIARERLRAALSDETELADRHEILSDIVARCDDIAYRSAAAYNLGVSFIKNDNDQSSALGDGIEWLRIADLEGASPALRARARDSIGHARYKLANLSMLSTPDIANPGDLGAMKEQLISRVATLNEAAGAFRSAHDVEPAYTPAIENLERVRREIKQLRDQIEALDEMIKQQEQAEQQRQQEQQQTADRLEDLAEQQQQESDENSQPPEQQPQDQDKQQSDQQELCDQAQSEQDGLNQMSQNQQSDQQEQMQQIQDKMNQARAAQERAKQALQEGKTEEAAQAQQEAAQALQEAAEQLREMSQSDGQEGESQGDQQSEQAQSGEQGQSQQGEDPSEEGDQIDEIAEMLLDKERREREARRTYLNKGRSVPVEKDW